MSKDTELSFNINGMDDFWKYIQETDVVITPFLAGFINVEGGRVGIATREFFGCEECEGAFEVTYSCDECGRTPKNFVQVRSGFGDGIYPYFELMWGDNLAGGLLVCDDGFDFTRKLREVISKISASEISPAEPATALWDFLAAKGKWNLEMSYITTLSIPEVTSGSDPQLLLSDSGGNVDSTNAVMRLTGYAAGTYSVFAFFSRDPLNLNISIPQFILILEGGVSQNIGLNYHSVVNWNEEAEMWMLATEASAIERNNIRTISLNAEYKASQYGTGYFNKEMEAEFKLDSMSWLAQLFAIGNHEELNTPTLDFFRQADPATLKYLYSLRGLHTLAEGL